MNARNGNLSGAPITDIISLVAMFNSPPVKLHLPVQSTSVVPIRCLAGIQSIGQSKQVCCVQIQR